ncbi:MAG: hypothetical protein ACTSW1_16010 [Candidatus Hodarchaeales archaeon]
MADIIDNYIQQISKNLRINKIDEKYIEEFIDNLRAQLYAQIEEIQKYKPVLDEKEAEIQVLTKCEPVETVVNRVIKELLPEQPKVRIENFSETRYLKFFERIMILLLVKIDTIIFNFKKAKRWYWRNENPAMTGLLYFGLMVTVITVSHIINLIFPSLYYITVYPSNKTFFSFSDSPAIPFEDSGIIGMSVSNVSSLVLSILAGLTILGLFIHLGWKYYGLYSSTYAIKASILVSALICTTWYFLTGDYSRSYIRFRTFNHSSGISYTQDWVAAQSPTLDQYLEYQTRLLLSIAFTFIPVIILVVLIGIWMKIMKTNIDKVEKRKKVLKYIFPSILVLLIIAITPTMVIDPGFPRANIPIPSESDGSIYYEFNIDWSSKYQSRNFSESYQTTLAIFGNTSFYFNELYNVSLTEDLSLKTTAELTPTFSKEEEQSSPSKNPFPILGLLYLPNQGLTDIIGNKINSSYPFQGYNPSIVDGSIKWLTDGNWVNLTVNTLVYASSSNNSVFTFNFDKSTGWLLKATLELDDNETWVTGFDLNELVISRRFVYNTIRNQEQYYNINFIIELVLILITVIIFSVTLEYYYKHPLQSKMIIVFKEQ